MSDELDQGQPGAPDPTPPAGAGVDPAATIDPATGNVVATGAAVDPATGAVTDPAAASPSTVATGEEHAAAPALDPGQSPEVASPAAPSVASPSGLSSEMPGDEGFVSSKPILMIGAAGEQVAELGYLLAGHGFPNAISDGKAAAPPILDDALMRVVVDFQQANGINPWAAEASASGLPTAPLIGTGHLGVVDARTWEKLLGYQPKLTPAGSDVAAEVNP